VITDRHIFVVGQQRVVGAKQATHIGRVVNGCVEIGVIADVGGRYHRDFIHPHQERLDGSLMSAAGAQQLAEPFSKRRPMLAADGH
jgi:hypothetical protein